MSVFEDPVLRHREIQRLGKTSTGQRLLSKDKLDEPPAPDPYTAAPEEEDSARMSHAALDAAEDELAGKYGRGAVAELVYLTHAQAGLGRSENERHVVLYEVERALRGRQGQVPAHKAAGLRDEVLKLSASQAGTVAVPVRDEVVRLSADHADILGLPGDAGDDDSAGMTVALSRSAGTQEQARHAAGQGGDSAEAIMDRHSRYFGRER